MTVETIRHASLAVHSAPFAPNGATTYSVDVTGTIADGGVELQILQNGSFVPLNPPVRFTPFEVGGTKQTGVIPAGTTLRWSIPGIGNNITTKIQANH